MYHSRRKKRFASTGIKDYACSHNIEIASLGDCMHIGFSNARRALTVWGLSACALVWPMAHAWAQKISVVYAREVPENDSRLEYPVRLLDMALRESGVAYELRSEVRSMSQEATFTQLAQGAHFNVLWSMTSRAREEQLLPIRIPIDKGLFGYRIAFVRPQAPNPLAQVRTLADLRKLRAGQGQDWPDTQILRDNGLPVVTNLAFEGLMSMLHAGRFDYFPRSVLEIVDEKALPATRGATVDEHVLIHYPAAIYFFVNKKDKALARTIERGLNKAIADGSFDTLFYERFGDVIQRANLRQRSAIALKNPLLPPETPLSRKALWLDITALPK